MTRRLRILDEASAEAMAAMAWYERERKGLGVEFAQAIDRVLSLIKTGLAPMSPMPGALGARGLKRLLLQKFPYTVVVRETADEYQIIAIAHQSRRPGYWMGK